MDTQGVFGLQVKNSYCRGFFYQNLYWPPTSWSSPRGVNIHLLKKVSLFYEAWSLTVVSIWITDIGELTNIICYYPQRDIRQKKFSLLCSPQLVTGFHPQANQSRLHPPIILSTAGGSIMSQRTKQRNLHSQKLWMNNQFFLNTKKMNQSCHNLINQQLIRGLTIWSS
jgi:hypothetical protein